MGSDVPEAAEETIVLPAEPASAARARDFVRRLIRRSRHRELEEAAVLCVTELVANVAMHTDSAECTVTFVEEPGDILIEVADHDRSEPMMERPGRMAEHGRGLRIIDSLAGEWGFHRSRGDGKSVWLRLCAQPCAQS